MNDQPKFTIIYQPPPATGPGPVEVFFTVIGAIVMLAVILMGGAR